VPGRLTSEKENIPGDAGCSVAPECEERMRSRGRFVVAVFPLVMLIGGCRESVGPDAGVRMRGLLQYSLTGVSPAPAPGDPGDPIRWSVPPASGVIYFEDAIEAPDTVSVGVPFEVAVHTVGPNGCWRADGTDVVPSNRIIEITPWDVHSGAEVCTLVIGYLRHAFELRLEQAGEWTLRATGRVVYGDEWTGVPITAERTVIAR